MQEYKKIQISREEIGLIGEGASVEDEFYRIWRWKLVSQGRVPLWKMNFTGFGAGNWSHRGGASVEDELQKIQCHGTG